MPLFHGAFGLCRSVAEGNESPATCGSESREVQIGRFQRSRYEASSSDLHKTTFYMVVNDINVQRPVFEGPDGDKLDYFPIVSALKVIDSQSINVDTRILNSSIAH